MSWTFSVFLYDNRWHVAVDIDGTAAGPGEPDSPHDDVEDYTWATKDEALAAVQKWITDRGLTAVAHHDLDNGPAPIISGEIRRA